MSDCIRIIDTGKHWSCFCGFGVWLLLGWVMGGCVGMDVWLVGKEIGVVWWEVLGLVKICEGTGVWESGGSGLLVVKGMCVVLLGY